MARIITRELALEIAKKLGATKSSKKNRPHDLYSYSYNGRLVCRFGIRRGSEKDKGHDHIPANIHVGPHDAKAFGECHYDMNWYIEQMKEKGIVASEEDE